MMTCIIFALVFVLIIVLTCTLYTVSTASPASIPSAPTFWSAAETRAFINTDPDGYLSGFTENDLHARGYSDIRTYTERVVDSVSDFTVDESAILKRIATSVDNYIRNPPRGSALARTFNTAYTREYLANLPWIFAKTTGGVYEQGMPHTRVNTIFLDTTVDTDTVFTPNVLLHEKIHLFTRVYPNETQKILMEYGFTPVPEDPVNIATRRANPDTDNRAYFSSMHGRVLTGSYSGMDPSHVNDIPNPEGADHPYEWLAYTGSDM